MELGSFTDNRDGRVYETVAIGNTIWFKTNLLLETEQSFCPRVSKRASDCAHGNFYNYEEKENVCPAGWRIPSEIEWEEYFIDRLQRQGGSIFDVRVDTLMEEFMSLIHKDTLGRVRLFGEGNPLGLTDVGWVEGKKVRSWGSTTFWMKNSAIADKRFHLHVSDDNYVFHRHAHNMDDVRRRRRKFMVKCVKTKE